MLLYSLLTKGLALVEEEVFLAGGREKNFSSNHLFTYSWLYNIISKGPTRYLMGHVCAWEHQDTENVRRIEALFALVHYFYIYNLTCGCIFFSPWKHALEVMLGGGTAC